MFEPLRPFATGLLALAATLCLTCADTETEPAVEGPPDERPSAAAAPLANAEDLDHAARFLAGFEPMGALAPDAWNAHAEEMDALWRELETRRLDNMRRFAEASLDLLAPDATLIYPFGGPDFLSANRFFPEAKSIVLIGLEPPGEVWIPTLDTASSEFSAAAASDLPEALERLRGGFRSLLDAGYFVTRRMEEDLAGTHLNGVLPVLLMFLAHNGSTVVDAQYVELDPNGHFQDIVPLDGIRPMGLRLAFVDAIRRSDGERENPTEATPRTLYFVSQDLSNNGFVGSPLERFLERQDGFNVYMKSAQYLIHQDSFSRLRKVLVTGARDVLQDDSGIPLRSLDADRWQHRFFGVYTRTLPAYREYFQDDLRLAFAEASNVPPLDFALGYNTDIGGGGLIWAQRTGIEITP